MRATVLAGLGLWMALGGAGAQEAAAPGAAREDMHALVEASRATAKATREAVEYGRAVPDILTQILVKLDKIEDKLDRVETASKAAPRR